MSEDGERRKGDDRRKDDRRAAATVAWPELETGTAVSPIAGKGNGENRDKKEPARTGRTGSLWIGEAVQARLRPGTVIFTVFPFSPGKLVNIASIRLGTRVPSSSVCDRALALPSNSGVLSTRRTMLRSSWLW